MKMVEGFKNFCLQ